jgi:hypothetical protein
MDINYEEFSNKVRGKKVLVIGPAKCVLDDLKNIKVDDFDYICRLNLHWRIPKADQEILGNRTDILYHCFNIDQYSVDDIYKWKQDENLMLISRDCPIFHKSYRKIQVFAERNKNVGLKYASIPNSFFKKYQRKFKGINPSTGVIAILHLCSLDAIVYAVGFDFYQTLYWNKTDDKQLINIHKTDHKPKQQLRYFKKEIKKFKKFTALGKLKELLK